MNIQWTGAVPYMRTFAKEGFVLTLLVNSDTIPAALGQW
jgi:hypothetical protein